MIVGHIKIPLVQRDERLIYYQNGKIFEMSGDGNLRTVSLDIPLWVKLASLSRLTIRLFRFIPRAACIVQENLLLFSLTKRRKEFIVRDGFSNPLNIVPVAQKEDFIAIFGDYGGNKEREPVYVYGITKDLRMTILYRFPENTIRHIHNIIPDPDNHSFLILTGDTGKDSGIYRLEDRFKSCAVVAAGEQRYRAVQGFLRKSHLIYATDAVMEDNYIYEMNLDTAKCRRCGEINGSCIYGTEYFNTIFISTCVEADETVQGMFRKWFTGRLGSGIKNKNVTVLKINANNQAEEIASFEKDRWPMKLFQYGTVLLPQIYGDNRFLYYLPLGVKKSDLRLKKYYL